MVPDRSMPLRRGGRGLADDCWRDTDNDLWLVDNTVMHRFREYECAIEQSQTSHRYKNLRSEVFHFFLFRINPIYGDVSKLRYQNDEKTSISL